MPKPKTKAPKINRLPNDYGSKRSVKEMNVFRGLDEYKEGVLPDYLKAMCYKPI